MKLAQLKAMIYYELMILWRRRVLLVVMVGTLIIMLGMTENLRQQLQAAEGAQASQIAPTEAYSPEEMEYWQTGWLIPFSTMSVLMIILVVAIPIIMAERIPYDRQYGVRELLNSLPLGQGTYLTGKLLGTWMGLLLGLTGVMLTSGLLNRLLFGPYFVGGYLLAFISLLPLALFAAGVSVMLAAGQPNRQRAVLVGFIVIIYLLVNAISPFQSVYMELQLAYWEQSIPEPLRELTLSENAADYSSAQSRLQLITAQAALQLALGWLITWGWMRWREGR